MDGSSLSSLDNEVYRSLGNISVYMYDHTLRLLNIFLYKENHSYCNILPLSCDRIVGVSRLLSCDKGLYCNLGYILMYKDDHIRVLFRILIDMIENYGFHDRESALYVHWY